MALGKLFMFGCGFSAQALVKKLESESISLAGTTRDPEKMLSLQANGIAPHIFHSESGLDRPADALSGTTHLLISIPPTREGADPVLKQVADQVHALAPSLEWIGYLSTTSVYGNRGGDWVDEESALSPNTERGERRLSAEREWLAFGDRSGVPVHLFRLAGIYGPRRNQLKSLREGTAKRIVKAGQVFSRIHVEDIASVLAASMKRPNPGRAYNVCDDEPAPPQEVVRFAAEMMGVEPPPEIPFELADLSPMAASFYADSKRCSNKRIKTELEVELTYPTYREGLRALYEAGAY